jgi:hypothetical protein
MLGNISLKAVAAAAAALAATAAAVPAASAHGAPAQQHGQHEGHGQRQGHGQDGHGQRGHGGSSTPDWTCGPSASAVSFSDALDKKVVDGATIGGLSDIAWDPRTRSYVSSVDNHVDDPSRLWFYRDLSDPTPVGDPLVLTDASGTPYTGVTADNEGLAVLPNGDFVVSSETEPSVRIFSPKGVQIDQLAVPSRFAVAPAGESTSNATFEGLTLGEGGRQIIVSMEGTLSGDTGDGTYRRILIYTLGRAGYTLTKQVGYRVDAGNRIPEIQEYAPGKLLVMEAAFSTTAGNSIELYGIDLRHAPDISDVADLSTAPQDVLPKTLVSDVTSCPDLGATAKETQTNPLMDNFEGMVTMPLARAGSAQGGHGRQVGRGYARYERACGHGHAGHAGHAGRNLYAVTLISDDNFSATQTTRVLNLVAQLP